MAYQYFVDFEFSLIGSYIFLIINLKYSISSEKVLSHIGPKPNGSGNILG